MPTPISNSPTSPATPSPETAPIGPPPPPVVTIDPVYIEGDAGRQELVKRHAVATAAPNCLPESKSAAKGSLNVGAGVLATLTGAATGGPLGLAAGLVALFAASLDEGAALRNLYDCKKQ